MKKYIPNLCTSLNLFSGCVACVMAFEGAYLWVVVWVIAGGFFDFCDGFFARVLNAPSAIGKELDSLADLVSFGVAPALAVFTYLSTHAASLTPIPTLNVYLPYISFMLAIFSALRLAKFNIDTRQTSSFMGLNTPANAFFWISYIFTIQKLELSFLPVLTIVLIIVFSFLLIAEIPMFSLKIKNIKLKGNELRYLLVVFIILAVIFAGISGIAAGMLFYILLSVLSAIKKRAD